MRFRLITSALLSSAILLVSACANDPYCPEGQSWCWAQCVDLESDENNCGSCDNTCESGWNCIDRTCEDPCAEITCSNHGRCRDNPYGDPYCVCDSGYEPHGFNCVPDLYSSCSGTPFSPACADFSCVDEVEEETYIELFWDELLKRLDGDEEYMREHVFLNDVRISYSSVTNNRLFRVDYLFIYDWVSIRTSAEARPLDPFSEEEFREQINDIGWGIEIRKKYSEPVDYELVAEAIDACGGSIEEVDWCHVLSLKSLSGDLVLGGHVGTIDNENNECLCIHMSLETGEYRCEDCVCWYE